MQPCAPRTRNPHSIPHLTPTHPAQPHPLTSQHCAFRPNSHPPPSPTTRRSPAGASPLALTVTVAVDWPRFLPLPRVSLAPQPLVMLANVKAVVVQFEAKRPDFFFQTERSCLLCERATPHKTAELFFSSRSSRRCLRVRTCEVCKLHLGSGGGYSLLSLDILGRGGWRAV